MTISIQERFEEFDRNNPRVYLALEKLALERAAKKPGRFGIKRIMEVIRWDFEDMSAWGDEFKINNSYTSRYARKLITLHPDLKERIETRQLKTY